MEHDSAKRLIAEIEAMKPSERLFDAKVKIFAGARDSGLDLAEPGAKMAARKAQLA